MMSRFKVKQRNTKLREKGLNSFSLHINDNRHRIVDENNNTIDRESLIENVIQRVKKDKEQQKELLFDSNAFLVTDNEILDKIKILGVKIIVNFIRLSDQIKINFDEMINFILKNVLVNKDIKYFDKNFKTR